ncbi:MAG: Unknown protein [uncultured Thiotrichaceae bacterium]|uniref:Uncharacterized protein n=1 Tax=uncultured Thiotrichaceae bacterium TaxID=298394 RepID=A0A6S6SRW1_9GAMM|nr:MAG: Unknown protein [uncultured Thiotrichaceae bacterium]
MVSSRERGGIQLDNTLKNPLIKSLALQDQEMNYLVTCLESLTGSNVDILVSESSL